ncbi:MAG: dockerin type I repeat-containing protein, partial [bacterium]|nr:dockerin type I repeat-containing protein [bacterium]MDW8163229.1 dockerin type I repeat-containing protein [Candidatus Omnitrophota bacterium]
NIEGAVVKLYDYNGNQVNLAGKVFYTDTNGNFDPSLTSTTSSGGFIIINLDPGLYFIKGEKQGIEFPVNLVGVFADGFTIYGSQVEIPELFIWAGNEIQVLPEQIQKNAQNVEMLRFNLWRQGPENVVVQSIKFTAKGTGSISNSVSSVKLYYRPNWTGWELVGTGSISGNKIIFNNLNLVIWESGNPSKFLSLVFDFNGNASPGQTFGVDILSNDIVAIGQNTQTPAQINGLPVYGKITTIAQTYPPQKPQNVSPANGATNIDGTNYTLMATNFNPGSGNPNFVASQWQIRKYNQTYTNSTYDSGENYFPTNSIYKPVILEEVTTYYWRVRYKNGDNVWSDWSDETWFTTGKSGIYSPPNKPTNQSPTNGQTDIDPKNCQLISSPFSSNSGDTHLASQWQIREENGTNPIFDSGFNTQNKTSIIVPANILSYNKTYYWRVRHFGQNTGWSEWSDETWFKTIQRQKGDINGDGEIDITDVILCLRMAIGLNPFDPIGDMNSDGEIDITDVIKVLRKAIGLD